MDGKAGVRGAVLCTSLTLAAGCGGGENAADKSTPAKNPSGRASADRGLPAPIEPTCGLDGFKKSRVMPMTSGPEKTRAWSLEYARARPSRRAGETTTLVLVEVAPAPLPAREPGVRVLDVSGRRVQLRPPANPGGFFSAQWRTSRALYSMLANGTGTQTLRRVIGCLP